MQPTPYPDINTLLAKLLAGMQAALGEKLVGLYLYGSLVTGDFDHDISDIDLLAATTSDIDENEFHALEKMQAELVEIYPAWHERLEIIYFSRQGLKTFRTERTQMAITSPGEPFHIKDAGIEWLMNWYFVRENGMVLFGTDPHTIIDPIPKTEFIAAVKEHLLAWREYIKDVQTRGSQAYAILTMCRGLYSVHHGEQVSKIQAARWAEQHFPDWAALIQSAVLWRKSQWHEEGVDHVATLDETRRFVSWGIKQTFPIYRFEYIWTTEIDDYRLLKGEKGDQYSIFHVKTTGVLIIEDDELYEQVIEKMKQAGVKVMTSDELFKFIQEHFNPKFYPEDAD